MLTCVITYGSYQLKVVWFLAHFVYEITHVSLSWNALARLNSRGYKPS